MRLFWRIFLGFWLATILMIVAVLSVSELLPLRFPGDRGRLFQPDRAISVLTDAIDAYEKQGTGAFIAQVTIPHSSIYLFDRDGKILLKDGTPPPFYEAIVRVALQSGESELLHKGRDMVFASPIQSATGRNYAVVLTISTPKARISRPRFWLNLTVAMLVVAIVCMLLSLYLTRPITRLRTTAQRLADGDLSARAEPLGVGRRDELGDLARDFDTMAARIQTLMSAQRRFVADVSHELGAPLTRLHLALALLRRQSGDSAAEELTRIERETNKLSNLVQQLLLLAGLEAGSCPAESLAPVSTGALCEGIIEDANFEATQTNCTVTGSWQDVTTLAYPRLLRRAIDNILRNAIRYSPPGGEVRIDCKVADDKQNVVFEVMDSGPGVPESMLFDIFRPFFRTAPGRETTSG